ncbi:hypothetical protein MAR_013596 [Mya arenaria]|uniref:Gustatory receptor n=1 Tax=Mya arenaria TaxID=6604 RepID=A0ABY7G0C8_MYAAR|nr:hypothetical protein MAR_013596 [Mya arenaria]
MRNNSLHIVLPSDFFATGAHHVVIAQAHGRTGFTSPPAVVGSLDFFKAILIFSLSERACISPSQIEAHCTIVRTDIDTSQEQELFHASNMTSNRSLQSSNSSQSLESTVRVEIADFSGESSFNMTTTHLKRCKRQVLRPYGRLLMFIGWRGFGREYVNSGSFGWRFLNTIYPIFIIIMLFYTYCYEIVACQWKLNVVRDTQIIVPANPITTSAPVKNHTHVTSGFFPFITMDPAEVIPTNLNLTDADASSYPLACEHVITTYVVPNILHLVAFIMGLVHFRVQENEHLYALMENVFLQASPLNSRSAPVLHWFLFCIELVGMSIVNSIFVAVVTNYYTQCQMILFYVKTVAFKLQEKSIDLKTAMKAARVNSVCGRFRKIALEVRVFGYKSSSMLELDSFLNFVSHTHLRAKLFHVPILPRYLISISVLSLFVVLILLQTSVIGSDRLF